MKKVAMYIAVLFILGSCMALMECGGPDPDSPMPPDSSLPITPTSLDSPVSPPVAPLQPTDTTVPSPVPTTVPTASLQPTEVPTQSPLPVVVPTQAPPAVCDCSGDVLNCPDFGTQLEAQACYKYCLQQTNRDIHGLDGNDKDGMVCEGLP